MLGYRSTFAIDVDASAATDRDHVVTHVLGEGLNWLRRAKKDVDIDSVEPGVLTTLGSGREVVHIHDTTASGTEYARLVAFDPPLGDGQRWVTSLLVGIDHHGENRDPRAWPMVSVEIEAPTDTADPSRARWTSRPRLVESILGSFTCDDHGFRMGDGPRLLSADQVDELLVQLSEDDHHGLVILCGEDGTVPREIWKDRLAQITLQTLGQASVFILDGDAMEEFNAHVSPAHRLGIYAPRTFRPGAVLDDPQDGYRHRVLSMNTLLHSSIDQLTLSFGRASREHANQIPPDRFLRRLDVITGMRLDELTRRADAAATGGQGTGRRSPTGTAGPARDVAPTPAPVPAPVAVPPAAPSPLLDEGDARGRELAAINADLESRLATALVQVHDLEVHLDEARADVARITDEGEKKAIEDREALDAALKTFRTELEDQELENAAIADELRAALKRVGTVEYQLEAARACLRESGADDGSSLLEPRQSDYDITVDSWDDLRTYAEMDVFDHLRFVCDWQDALDLAVNDPTGRWVRSTWDALAMLNDYARCQTDPACTFSAGLREYLGGQAPAGCRVIPAGRLRNDESETVRGRKDWMRERTFSVPRDVSSTGVLEMVTHIVIQTRGSVCPRLYFEDRTTDLGEVVIGYIGSHPTNTKTS